MNSVNVRCIMCLPSRAVWTWAPSVVFVTVFMLQ